MKELHARAAVTVAASEGDTMALLRAVEDYPRWYPDGVRSVSVLERDDAGAATKVRATLHIAQGPLVRDFGVTLSVTTPAPGTIKLSRQRHDARDQEAFDVGWRIVGGDSVRIELALDANLSVPRLLPVGGVAEGLAQGFVRAAANALAG